jgi:hypothetical protein
LQTREVLEKGLAELRIPESQANIGFEVAHAITRIVMLALKAKPEERPFPAKQVQSIRKLDFSLVVRINGQTISWPYHVVGPDG